MDPSRKGSTSSLENFEKSKEEAIKKRVSITSKSSHQEETNIKDSLHHLQESIQSINFPYPISFQECNGIDDVIITPPFMEFKDGSEGNIMEKMLTLQNVGKKAAIIRIKKPNSMTFDIKILKDGYRLCPGLSLTRVVRYTFKQSSSLHSMIPIEINGVTIDYHLICTMSFAYISVEPTVLDFGYVDVGSVSEIKMLTIINEGGKSARFCIDVGLTSLPLIVQPSKGLIKPNDTLMIGVQVAGERVGFHQGQFWIKSHPNIHISITINIIDPKLIIHHPLTIDGFSLINFPITFLETRRFINIPIQNYSSQRTCFVLMTECHGCLKNIQEIDRKEDPAIDVFRIYPSEGFLEPFEETVFTVCFCPTKRRLRSLENKNIDYFTSIIKVCKVQLTEAKDLLQMEPISHVKIERPLEEITINDDDENKKIIDENSQSAALTLYLYGQFETAKLNFTPSELKLGNLNIDDKIEKLIIVANPSKHLPVTFSFITRPCVRCEPRHVRLGPNEEIQVFVTINVQFNLESSFKLEFDLSARSYDINESNETRNIIVSREFIQCTYNPQKASGKLKRFKSVCKIESFNKLPLEPDYSLTYTTSEQEMKMNHREFWTHYFRIIFSRKTTKPLENTEIEYDNLSCHQLTMQRYSSMIRDSSELNGNKENDKDNPIFLTPLNISKICVSPNKLELKKIVINTTFTCYVKFENKNDFQVKISLISLNLENITFPEESTFIIKPKSSKISAIDFSSQHFGIFRSHIHYEINDIYKYQLPISTSVVSKMLELKTKEVIFDKESHAQEGYRIPFKIIEIENKLNADARFVWVLPENVNFKIEPLGGTVPSNGYIFGCVYQSFDPTKLNRAEAILQMEGGGREVLKMEIPLRTMNVVLLNDTLEIGEIPLNVEHRTSVVLYNTEYSEAFFEIDEKTIFKGIEIIPNQGTISPRSVMSLQIRLKFDTCMEAAIAIDIIVQKRLTLQLKLNFSVIFPKLKLEPSEIRLRKVYSNSYRLEAISAENLTNTEITMKFPFKEYPEFRITRSTAMNDYDLENDGIVQISPRSKVELFLHFEPCDLAYYSFDLPIIINEFLGNVNSHDNNFITIDDLANHGDEYSEIAGITLSTISTSLPKIHIECTVTHPIICFNKLKFKFNVPVFKDEFRICNKSEDEVSILLLTSHILSTEDCPFRINWIKGIKPKCTDESIHFSLQPNEQIRFEISFKPKESGRFVLEVPIHVGESENEQFYNELILEGFHSAPCLNSDISEIHFIPLPLKVSSKEKFNIQVYSFQKPTCLRAKICCPERYLGTFDEQTLKICFPDGDSINPCCSHDIDVEITFKSEEPTSFSTKIIFFDVEESTSVSILIYAAANNGLLTKYFYEKELMVNFRLTKRSEESPDHQVDKQRSVELSIHENIQVQSKRTSVRLSENKNESKEERNQSMDSRKSILLRKIEDSSSNVALNIFHELSQPVEPELESIKNSCILGTMSSIERWLYTDIFKYQFYPKLADQLSLNLSKVSSLQFPSDNDKKETKPEFPNFMDILKNLINSDEFPEYIFKDDHSEENITDSGHDVLERCNEILNLLITKKVYVAHIPPKFLLKYDEYKTIEKDPDYTLTEYSFQIQTEYSWLELFLQLYDCFVLSKINENVFKTHDALLKHANNIDSDTYKINKPISCEIVDNAGNYCKIPKSEKLLAAWLECHHTIQFNFRRFKNFESCVSDGLFFIAVTISYCPFLKNEFFKNIYLKPNDLDQKMHNAICLVLAWKKIRLGFIVTPSEIVKSHPIQMLMLSVHLFLILPTYLIKDKIQFECPLTRSITETIKLPILCNNPMNFVVQFFGNDLNLFSTKQIITLYPRKSQQIKVTFNARKIQRTKVFLMLCGSAIGPYFAENQTFSLEGYPNEIEISEEHTIKSKLYQIVKKNLNITVPYDYNNDYEIWISEELPNNIDELKIICWADLEPKQMLRRLVFHDNSVTLQEESQTIIVSLTIGCLTPDARSFWIFFRSDLAEFVIQINSKCQNSITDSISLEIKEEQCICPDYKQVLEDCPLSRIISIPSVNKQLLNSLKQMFLRSLNSEEKSFWAEHLDNPIGIGFILRFIRNIQDNSSDELKHITDPTVIYKVESNRANLLVLPRAIAIEDGLNSNDEIEMIMHISKFNSEIADALITLTSLDKKKVRVCKVDFIYERSTNSSVGSSRSTIRIVKGSKTKRNMTIL